MLNNSFHPFPVLQTGRLLLRQLNLKDDNEIFTLRSDKEVNRYIDRAPCDTIEDARNFIYKIEEVVRLNKGIYWALNLIGNDKLIGTISLYGFSEKNDAAEIGYELLPAYQRQGIMQEALFEVIAFGFGVIGLKSIVANTHPANESSTKLLMKFNFKKQLHSENDQDDNLVLYKLSKM